ncbi:hypothetical protein V2G26_019485 [Clonostachys chloroleuca]
MGQLGTDSRRSSPGGRIASSSLQIKIQLLNLKKVALIMRIAFNRLASLDSSAFKRIKNWLASKLNGMTFLLSTVRALIPSKAGLFFPMA